MKKLILCLLMVLFGLPVLADEYVNDISDAIIRVKFNLNRSSATNAELDSVITGYMREAALAVSAITNSKLKFDTVLTTAYDYFVAYDTLIHRVTDVSIFSRDSLKQLQYAPRETWDDLEANESHLNVINDFPERLPTHYDWDNGYLFFYPVPGHTGDSVLIIGYAKPGVVQDSLALVDVSVIHRPALIYYATACLAARLNLLPQSELWYKKYEQYISMLNGSQVKPSE